MTIRPGRANSSLAKLIQGKIRHKVKNSIPTFFTQRLSFPYIDSTFQDVFVESFTMQSFSHSNKLGQGLEPPMSFCSFSCSYGTASHHAFSALDRIPTVISSSLFRSSMLINCYNAAVVSIFRINMSFLQSLSDIQALPHCQNLLPYMFHDQPKWNRQQQPQVHSLHYQTMR